MKEKVRWLVSLFLGRFRLMLGFCPMCNSDAPALDNCPVCRGCAQSKGDTWPPHPQLKRIWWRRYKEAIDAKLMISNKVAEARKNRVIH